jgi:hypothetical protein
MRFDFNPEKLLRFQDGEIEAQWARKNPMTFTHHGRTLSSEDFHDIMSGLRGPDMEYPGSRLDIIKSCTAVVVRRALYGRLEAAQYSDPEYPMEAEFLELTHDEIIQAVGDHFVNHMVTALKKLIAFDMILEEDRELVIKVMKKLKDLV